jgi:hypothetical protein
MRYPLTDAEMRKMFETVQNMENWKCHTTPITVQTREEADKYVQSICFFAGGAEIELNKNDTFTVKSKGYYYYIGA